MAVALAALSLAGATVSPAAGASGWSSPFRMAPRSALDLIPAQIAFSLTGATAVGYGVEDADDAAGSEAYLSAGSSPRRLGRPRALRGVQRILDLLYDGSGLELLVGTSPRGEPCCSSARVVAVAQNGVPGRTHTLVRGLAGATVGQLAAFSGRLLAAVATERGVWVSQSGAGSHFGGSTRLTAANVLPEALGLTTTRRGATIVAWAAATGQPTAPGARRIFVAQGSRRPGPGAVQTAVVVPAGHWINELGLARSAVGATLAWVESWFDVLGAYHAEVMVADLQATVRVLPVSAPVEAASGLAFAADARGDQALAWRSCPSTGACSVRALLRGARHRFPRAQRLGSIDGSQSPAVALAPSGESLLSWVQRGHVLAARARNAVARFGAEQLVSSTNYAADLALAFGPRGQALAAWTQGTLVQSLVGAAYSAG